MCSKYTLSSHSRIHQELPLETEALTAKHFVQYHTTLDDRHPDLAQCLAGGLIGRNPVLIVVVVEGGVGPFFGVPVSFWLCC